MKFSERTKYYALFLFSGSLLWLLLVLIQVEFINALFMMLAYIWHFSLLAPGVKEMALANKNKLSLLAVVFRFNFYLQTFIKLDKFNFTSSLVRSISPMIFVLFLFIVGGSGNIIFALLGSLIFEIIYLIFYKKIKVHLNDLEIPPAIPSEENFRE